MMDVSPAINRRSSRCSTTALTAWPMRRDADDALENFDCTFAPSGTTSQTHTQQWPGPSHPHAPGAMPTIRFKAAGGAGTPEEGDRRLTRLNLRRSLDLCRDHVRMFFSCTFAPETALPAQPVHFHGSCRTLRSSR